MFYSFDFRALRVFNHWDDLKNKIFVIIVSTKLDKMFFKKKFEIRIDNAGRKLFFSSKNVTLYLYQ